MRKQLFQTINTINPDILIGVSYSKAELICSIPCKAKKIIECHESKSLILSKIYNGSLISKLYTKYYYYKSVEQKADIVVTLTNEGKKEWKKAKRVEVIPNFSSMTVSKYSTCKTKKIIAAGRLREEKGFDRLIDIWKMISRRHPDWQLNIFGEGYLKDELNNKINTNNIKNITIKGSTSNISKEYSNSSICVLYLTCECQKGGADKEEDFNVNQHLKALHIRFLPDQAQEDNLSSREFIKKADFVNIKSLLSGKAETEGEGGDDEENGTGGQNQGGTQGGDSQGGSQNQGGTNNTGGGTDTEGGTNTGDGGDDDGLDKD